MVFGWGSRRRHRSSSVRDLRARRRTSCSRRRPSSRCNLLECVNYIEHWGLRRHGTSRVRIDRLLGHRVAGSRYYTLVGLSRHADHHAHAAKPFPQLKPFEETPKLPYGYFASVLTVLFRNGWYRRYADTELKKRQLGPYEPATV